MKVLRKYRGLEVTIELTEDELYKAHREFVVDSKKSVIRSFIEDRLDVDLKDCNLSVEDINALAEVVYEEEVKGFTEIYAIAKTIVPELKARGVLQTDISEKLWIEE